jgi:very-short-patch-repair endonuclease
MTAPALLHRDRDLRHAPTNAEQVLWERLRARRLKGHKFSRHVWIGPFIADFVCEDRKLIVELDGQHGTSIAYDATRAKWLSARGYRVKRYWSNEVLTETEAVVTSMLSVLSEPSR